MNRLCNNAAFPAASGLWIAVFGAACGGSGSSPLPGDAAAEMQRDDGGTEVAMEAAPEESAPMDAGRSLPDGPSQPTSCGVALFGGESDPWENPAVQCRWVPVSGENAQVGSSPVVIDLELDGRAEILFLTPAKMGLGSRMHAIRGTDCSEVWSVNASLYYSADLAVGDVTGDGIPEIVGYDQSYQVMRVFDLTGRVVAEGDRLGAYVGQGAPAIADLDGKPPAEIVMSDAVFQLVPGTEWLKTLWVRNTPYDEHPTRFLTVLADVDGNGEVDMVTGNRIFSGVLGENLTPSRLSILPPGKAAVAQIDPSTPEPEIVLQSYRMTSGPGRIEVVSAIGGVSVFGPYSIPSRVVSMGVEEGFDSAPTVADFDGDGQPEIGVAGVDDYRVYDPECAADPLPAGCSEPGVLWASALDGTFGGVAFDFNDDCSAEVVHADRCHLRIFDGATGATLGQAPIGAPPVNSQPVVADVDGDGHAEIVVASQGAACGAEGGGPGLTVFRDADRRWAYARRIWNQHTYHVTNVEEDGSIPNAEKWVWETKVGFRNNVGRAP